MSDVTQTCSVTGCLRPAKTRGWCRTHYDRVLKHGEPGAAEIQKKGQSCEAEGCTNKHHGRGFCATHAKRALPMKTPCVIEGCANRIRGARGMCDNHYHKWLRGSDPNEDHVRGEKHPLWRGSDITYASMHARTIRFRGSASGYSCVECAEQAAHWAYAHGSTDELIDPERGLVYSADVDDYQPMCVSCHHRLDRTFGRRLQAS